MLRAFAARSCRGFCLLAGMVVAAASAQASEPDGSGATVSARPAIESADTDRPASALVLRGLYGSFATMQALDVVSTNRALTQGSMEANPILRPFVGNTGAFIALKVASTVTTIVLAHRLSKKSRVGASPRWSCSTRSTAWWCRTISLKRAGTPRPDRRRVSTGC